MTIVAAVSLPSTTAREEARTAMGGCVIGDSVHGGVVAGVGYGWIAFTVDIIAVWLPGTTKDREMIYPRGTIMTENQAEALLQKLAV